MDREQEIRLYLSNLSKLELADSVYLFALDFMNCPMEDIYESIVNLYVEVSNLRNIIENRLSDDNIVLTKEELGKQQQIFEDYSKKSNALDSVMGNNVIYESVITKIVAFETKRRNVK